MHRQLRNQRCRGDSSDPCDFLIHPSLALGSVYDKDACKKVAQGLQLQIEQLIADSSSYSKTAITAANVFKDMADQIHDIDAHDFDPEEGQVTEEGMKA